MRPAPLLSLVFAVLLAPALATAQSPEEATVFICGVWPDRVLFFDQTTDTFGGGLRLRHGAVTASGYTPDKRRFFLVTDRMESVEVIDPIRREVVDEFKLSTPEHRIRIFRVFPNQDGTRVYLSVSVVRLETDRFVRERDYDFSVYDLERHEVVDRFKLPEEVMRSGRRPNLHVAPDGKSFYAFGRDIFQIDAESHEILDTIVLSKPLLAGYGAFRGMNLTETDEPGVFYGIYRTTDPVLKKRLFGVTRLDLYGQKVETFELGPDLRLNRFALSPDGKRGYAGLNDMVIVDMEQERVLDVEEEFERGRTNTSMIVSHDGKRLYISGVGDTVYVYDAGTLERIKTVFAGGDFMMPPVEIPNPGVRASNNEP